MELEQFKTTYSLNVRRANYWSGINSAYEEYKAMGKKEFEKELYYRIEVETFGRWFYDDLREKFNADYECVEFYYQMMKERQWTYEDFRNYIENYDEDEHEEDGEGDEESDEEGDETK